MFNCQSFAFSEGVLCSEKLELAVWRAIRIIMDQNAVIRPTENFAVKVINTFIGGIRSTVENSVHGVLTVLNLGCKQKVPPVDNELLYFSATILAEKIRKAEITSEEVVKAYINRISEVNGLINAVIEGRYEEAMNEARLADQLVRSGTLTEAELAEKYPLLGIPFTAKEAILIKGLPSTCGLVCRKGMTAEEDSEPVQRLKACGGIPLALTNTSEICMWWETYNKLHGRTNNPYDTTRTVGGSSGGEAALIAAAGSVIGIGTDLGGSIRLPAFFTGIFGHKPTQGLVPIGGQFPPALEEISPYVVVGPMTRYATDLKLMLSAFIGKDATEELKLFSPVDIRSIKVYYMLDDGGSPGSTPVSPELKDAIKRVVSVLSMEGLSVQEVKIKHLKLGFLIWCAYLSKVKEQRIANIMKGNVKKDEDAHLEMLKWFSGKSEHTFPIILNACAQDYLAPVMRKPLEFFIQCGDRLKEELLKLLQPEPAVFLYPTFPHAAAHHGQILANPFNASYSVVFNALSLPATQCPLGFCSNGLPFGVQIATAPGNDRLSISLAEHLEVKLGGWTPP
ncbi:Fatty-acid amide hydrolase 2 like protein [Argiope bruennichi]|uniref:Fatty-acid amide hydrolase 2 like protein n=1 Tax=Argiope bruennichi TaxID=94029 RepID=A0A8T0EWW3_ARGBR|nr:Fatty-acid amide hydrolase 2 like protein [Argiope bruennichi]